jgi:hypothetical protein
MSDSGPRNVAASVVGWMIVVVILWFFFGSIFATIRFVIRIAAIVLVIAVLLWIYFKLKGDDDE